jgi:nitrite reductase (NADH) large subunit
MNSLNYFGLDIATAGIVVPPDDGHWEVVSQRNNGAYQKIVLNDDIVMGMVFIKDIEKSGMIFGLMKDRVKVTDFRQALLADDFGLAYLPRELWQERLGAVPAGSTSVLGMPAEAEEPVSSE